MFCKLNRISFQKFRLIPVGGIKIIVIPIQQDDVPGMPLCASRRAALHIDAGNSQIFQKILGSACVPGTHRLFFPEDACHALVILRLLVLCGIDQIGIHCFGFFVVICPLWKQRTYLLTGIFRRLLDFFDLFLCVAVSRGKGTVIAV